MPQLKNNKQEQFVQEYLLDLNATQAAIRAGYAPRSAQQISSRLMSIGVIRARLDELLAQRSARTGVNADRVIRELARIAFANVGDFINVGSATLKTNASQDDTAAIQSVRVKTIPTADGDGVEREIRLSDKNRALELLGKHLGMFDDRTRVSVNLESLEKLDSILGGIDEMAAEDSPDGGS